MERLLEKLRKKKNLTEKQVAKAVLREIKGGKDRKRWVFNKLLVELQLNSKPRNSFKYTVIRKGLYHITETKNGITSIYDIKGIEEVRNKKKEWKGKKPRVDVVEAHIPQIKTSIVYKQDKVREFYNSLTKHYYIIKDFTVKLYDGDNDQVYMLNDEGEEIEELKVAKFFITQNKPDLSNRKDISYYRFKKLKDGSYVLFVMPKIYFRNSRVIFNKHLVIGREMTINESSGYWKTAQKIYGYEETAITVKAIRMNDLKKADATESLSVYDSIRIIKKKKEEAEENKRQLEQISKLEVQKIKSRKCLAKMVMKVAYHKNISTSVENRLSNRVDRHFRKEKRAKEINNVVNEYNRNK